MLLEVGDTATRDVVRSLLIDDDHLCVCALPEQMYSTGLATHEPSPLLQKPSNGGTQGIVLVRRRRSKPFSQQPRAMSHEPTISDVKE